MYDTALIPARRVTLGKDKVRHLLNLIEALGVAAEGDSNDAEIQAGHDLASDLLALLTPEEA